MPNSEGAKRRHHTWDSSKFFQSLLQSLPSGGSSASPAAPASPADASAAAAAATAAAAAVAAAAAAASAPADAAADGAADEIDQQFAMKEGCLENAFKRAKQWADYVRDVANSVEKMCALSVEYHLRMGDTVGQFMQVLRSEASSSLPLQSYYMAGAAIIQQDCQLSEQIFRTSVPQIVHEALRSRVKEHEAARKRLKADWAAAVRLWRKSLQAMEQARQAYYQRCAEVERAHSEYVQTNTKSTNLVLVASTSLEGGGGGAGAGAGSSFGGGGPPQLRGDPKHEAKLVRKKKLEEDSVARREAARRAYQRSIEELNNVTEQRERRKLETLRSVRELIERGDQCFIAATCGFFECYARAKESNNQELRSLSRTSHQNYRPGSKFREFVRTCISLDSDDPPPRYTFEEFGSGGCGSSGPPSRKESRGSGDHHLGALFTADVCDLAGTCCEDEIEEDDEESSAGETVCVATATATQAAYATSTATATATSKLNLASRIWCSTRDTANSLLQFRDKRQTLFKKPASTGHLLSSESQHQHHQHQHQHQHQQLVLARQIARHAAVVSRCIEAIEGMGLTTSGVYRVQAAKRRVLELSAQCDSPDESPPRLQDESAHTVCGLLKHRLLQLPDALLTGELYADFIEAGRDGADPARLSALVARLPRANRQLAGALFHHLARVADQQADNQMNSQNLALVFAPTVLRPRQEAAQAASGTASLSEVLDYGHQKLVAKALIDNAEAVFGQADGFSSAVLPSPDSGGGGGGADRQFLVTTALHVSLDSRVEVSSSSFSRTRQQQQHRRPPSAFDPQGVDFDDIDVDDDAGGSDSGEAFDAGGAGLRRVRTTGGGGQPVRKAGMVERLSLTHMTRHY